MTTRKPLPEKENYSFILFHKTALHAQYNTERRFCNELCFTLELLTPFCYFYMSSNDVVQKQPNPENPIGLEVKLVEV